MEDLFPPITSSPPTEITAPEKVPFIKEEDNMEYSCNDKPLISNLSPDTVMENSNTTQEVSSTDQPAPAQTQSGSLLTALLFSSPSVKTNDGGFNICTTNSELPFGSCSSHHTVLLEEKTGQGKRCHLYQEVSAKIRGYPVQKAQ